MTGEKYNSSSAEAGAFNQYFASVFLPKPPTPLCTTSVSVQDQLDTITVTVEEVNALLSNLSTAKATGPDGISARLLKECSGVLAPL
ncbi:Hypothetical predicted protein [Paramuricea clavata]|uniref:Uncharacterized protein n=1 Tax=Paramuricea clavata TaxID=317549 RepID=A0A6S7HBN3_PARCT|nr:Hypothetical predicted protein [Paramuricea clavata]